MDRRQGIVVRFHSNIVTVEDTLTQKRFLCALRGRFKAQNIRPIIGDIVEYTGFDDADFERTDDRNARLKGRIENIFPRRNVLDRPNIANIDQVLLVTTLKCPEVSSFIVDRFLVLAERNGLEVCLLINKIDLLTTRAGSTHPMVDYYSKDTRLSWSRKPAKGSGKSLPSSRKISTGGNVRRGKSTVLNQIDPSLGLKEGEISNSLRWEGTRRRIRAPAGREQRVGGRYPRILEPQPDAHPFR